MRTHTPSYVSDPASIVELAGVGRIEVGPPTEREARHIPTQVLAQKPVSVAVIEIGGGVASVLAPEASRKSWRLCRASRAT